jgi:glycine/D-amino acid oxidase-like deaminating enzyme
MNANCRLESYWNASAPVTDYPQLVGEARVDVAVVGGGIVGLTLADRLRRDGASVAVIESQRVGAQVTGRSTAKLTALHGLLYAELARQRGDTNARLYADANLAAIEYVADESIHRGIDCQFTRTAAYTYTASGQAVTAVHKEVATKRLGIEAG